MKVLIRSGKIESSRRPHFEGPNTLREDWIFPEPTFRTSYLQGDRDVAFRWNTYHWGPCRSETLGNAGIANLPGNTITKTCIENTWSTPVPRTCSSSRRGIVSRISPPSSSRRRIARRGVDPTAGRDDVRINVCYVFYVWQTLFAMFALVCYVCYVCYVCFKFAMFALSLL